MNNTCRMLLKVPLTLVSTLDQCCESRCKQPAETIPEQDPSTLTCGRIAHCVSCQCHTRLWVQDAFAVCSVEDGEQSSHQDVSGIVASAALEASHSKCIELPEKPTSSRQLHAVNAVID